MDDEDYARYTALRSAAAYIPVDDLSAPTEHLTPEEEERREQERKRLKAQIAQARTQTGWKGSTMGWTEGAIKGISTERIWKRGAPVRAANALTRKLTKTPKSAIESGMRHASRFLTVAALGYVVLEKFLHVPVTAKTVDVISHLPTEAVGLPPRAARGGAEWFGRNADRVMLFDVPITVVGLVAARGLLHVAKKLIPKSKPKAESTKHATVEEATYDDLVVLPDIGEGTGFDPDDDWYTPPTVPKAKTGLLDRAGDTYHGVRRSVSSGITAPFRLAGRGVKKAAGKFGKR